MTNIGILLIFWYGILHAFGPDHLTAIADFSIGKDKNKTMIITILFAIGHGTMLFIFATSGVMIIFICFGIILLYINRNLLHNKKNVKRIFATAGIISVIVGTNMLIG